MRVIASDGTFCGRLRDVYFDDQSWEIKYVVVTLEPRRFGTKQVLLSPNQIAHSPLETPALGITIQANEAGELPLESSVRPVCRQYATLALSSPGGNRFGNALTEADPHLRSARAVMNYRVDLGTKCGGALSDFIFDDESWRIRYVAVEQCIESRRIRFHILPQSVERFTWATERVLLRNLEPVEMAAEEQVQVNAA